MPILPAMKAELHTRLNRVPTRARCGRETGGRAGTVKVASGADGIAASLEVYE
jgi:hypothetical protein